jgi:carbonic anhydrase/acetyltransferase-like protein (isoleucine patch superfamily)
VVEEGGMLAARGLLTPGKRIGCQELFAGAPAKLLRVMSDTERAGWDETAPHYVGLSNRYRGGLRAISV